MGRIAKLLSFLRITRNDAKISDVKVDLGGGNNITCEHYSDSGDDSFPLATDYVATMPIPRTGNNIAVGYLDPINTKKALQGDKRIYSRDSSGASVAEFWLKNDGTIIMSNANGTFTLLTSGEFNINGARITTDGDVITASGVSLDNHPHEQGNDSNGDSEVTTDAPTATE